MGRRLKDRDALKTALEDALPLTQGIAKVMKAQDAQANWVQKGTEWSMVCPFHDDHNPSLDANDMKGLWICRSTACQILTKDGTLRQSGGDLIEFARRYNGWSFMEAVTNLCAIADIEIEPYLAEPTPEEIECDLQRAKLAELIRTLPYCKDWKGIDADVLREFDVREAPGHLVWRGALEWDDAADDMIVLPLYDDESQLVGWTTRSKSDSHESRNNPNNWPGSANTLYGMNLARKHLRACGQKLIVVEGQSDVLSMVSRGIVNTVALRGARMSDDLWNGLSRWHLHEIILCLDGDEAGQTATHTIAQQYWNQTSSVLSVATLPDGVDPGDADISELAVALTRPGLRDAVEFLLDGLEQEYETDTLSGRRAFIERALHGLKMSQAGGYVRKLIVAWMAERFNMPTLEISDLFIDEATVFSTITIEQAVLSRFMNDQQWGEDVAARISEDDFQYLRHKLFWRMLNHAASKEVDCSNRVALRDFAEQHGYADELTAQDFLQALFDRYTDKDYPLEQMIDATFRRRASDGAKVLLGRMENANADSDEAAASYTSDLVDLTFWRHGMTESKTKEEKVQETIDLIMERRENPDEIVGLDLGPCFPKLNSTLRGIQAGRLTVIAAAQSVGKTSFLNNLAAQVAIHGNVPSLLIGLEMGHVEYHTRFLAQMTGIDASRIDSSRLSDEESILLERAATKLMNAPLHIETPDIMNMDDLKLMVRSYKLRHGVEAVFYDYAQLTAPSREQGRMNRYEIMGDVAKTMKLEIARSMKVAFVTAAQLNREGAKDKRPTAENIGDSYQIAQTADVFLVMSEAEGNATALDVWVDKNRSGHKDVLIPMKFDRSTQIIHEATGGIERPPYLVRPQIKDYS